MSTEASALIPSGPHQPADLTVPGSAELIPFPSGRYAISLEDMKAFGALKPREQERIKFLLGLFAKMEAGGIVATSEALGFQLRAMRGYGASNLRALYYKWQEGGWRLLARNFTNGSEPLPTAFVLHLRALMEKNARSMKQAMNQIKRDWVAGEDVPGYGTWQQWFLTEYPDRDLPAACPGTPRGWGKSNLYALQPVKVQRALATRGLAHAKALLASMVRDTSSLLPLQLVVIDDFEIDQMCYVPEARGIVRMAGVAAMDVATRRIIGLILKPRLPGSEGQKQSITRAEVRFLLHNVLRDFGVPAHGMTILCENAAAAVTAELETTFLNLFGGKVAVARTGMIDRAVLEHGFKETGGKPWLKGWIESFFNLMHNVAAGELPGQKGANYLVAPGDLKEKLRAMERLIGTGPRDAQLSAEQLARACITFAKKEELTDAYLQIFKWIEERDDHAMHGFERVLKWRRDHGEAWQPWSTIDTLSPEEREKVQVHPFAQTPRERWAALFPGIVRHTVPVHVLMMLLLTPKKATLKNAKLSFTHNKVGYTWLTDPRGRIAQCVRDGADVLVYFDPTRPDHAHVARMEDGLPLGEVKRFGKVDLTDMAAVTEAERDLAAHYEAHLAEVRERPLHQLDAARRAADDAVNAGLIEEAAQQRKLGVTATLNRAVPDATLTSHGNLLAATVAEAEQTKSERSKQARALQQASHDTASLLDDADEPATQPHQPAYYNPANDLLDS